MTSIEFISIKLRLHISDMSEEEKMRTLEILSSNDDRRKISWYIAMSDIFPTFSCDKCGELFFYPYHDDNECAVRQVMSA